MSILFALFIVWRVTGHPFLCWTCAILNAFAALFSFPLDIVTCDATKVNDMKVDDARKLTYSFYKSIWYALYSAWFFANIFGNDPVIKFAIMLCAVIISVKKGLVAENKYPVYDVFCTFCSFITMLMV